MQTGKTTNYRNCARCALKTGYHKHGRKYVNGGRKEAAFYVKRNFGDVIRKLSSQ